MIAFANLDRIQQILDAAQTAGFILTTGDTMPLNEETMDADIKRAELTEEQMRAAEEQLARLEEAMRKDPN